MRKSIIIMAMAVVLLKAHYTQVPGTDPEYAQGAIERNEVAHREISHFVWVFEAEGTPDSWEKRLNASVDPKHGSFTVECATADEEERVRNGTIELQR
ncbi:MAG TPA: hypothetical protein VJ901_22875 [Thermoanaerobaculia bacterium]|nr:hypothetical protein [Thermoanaerobaculia bacterium]